MKFTQELFLELMSYDEQTGLLFWRERSLNFFPTQKSFLQWNGAWKGKEALGCVDKKGYKVGAIFYRPVKSHRAIWLMKHGYIPKQIDHINGIKSDNRIVNLREVDNAENHKNMGIQKNNRSGTSGVHWAKREKRWVAKIQIEGKEICLGYYKDLDLASERRKNAEIEFGFHPNHGDRIRNYD